MDPHADLHARIASLRRRADQGGTADVAEEMNDLLSEGYARALLEERRIGELDERVVDALVGSAERRDDDLRALATERRAASLAVERLRADLAAMHDDYLALRAAR